MLCPSCHTQNRDNAKFCKGCGLPFTAETIGASSTDMPSPLPAQEQQPPAPTPSSAEAVTQPDAQENPAPEATKEAVVAQDNPPVQTFEAYNATPAPAAEAHDLPRSQETLPEQRQSSEGESEDVSLEPTQILSPDKMLAQQSRRWQQELERERQRAIETPGSSQTRATDIADTPTMLMHSGGSFADASVPVVPSPLPQMQAQPDIADMPTVLIGADEQSTPIPPPPPPESLKAPAPTDEPISLEWGSAQVPPGSAIPVAPGQTQQESNESSTTAAQTANAAETATTIPGEDTPSTTQEGDAMEQVPPTDDQQSETAQEPSVQQEQESQPDQSTTSTDFPVLAVGTIVNDRYEITQVQSEDADKHTYQVIDRQGYRHCWNCGSEENTEEDDFCITCGAELLTASYILHEYSATASPGSESNVLQGALLETFVFQGHTYVVEQEQTAQTTSPEGIRLVAASNSDAGTVRRGEPNEDSAFSMQFQRVHESVSTPIGLFIVSDGMGGHANGQLASRMAIGVFAERMMRELIMPPLIAEKAEEEPPTLDEDSLHALLKGAVEDANTAICQVNSRNKTDMGATFTGFVVVGDLAYILNVGDSRSYLLREGTLYQLTNDHSLVGQLVAGGLIEPDDIYTHPQRSQIYRSIGDKLNVQVDLFKQQVNAGDILLSCSDGLWEMVRNPQITDILNSAPDPQTACSQLIEAANTNGGEDNISAVVVFVR